MKRTIEQSIVVDDPMQWRNPPKNHKWQSDVTIYLTFTHEKDKKLDEAKVKKIVESLKLNLLTRWRDCWRDDDSPQAEETFGVCKAA